MPHVTVQSTRLWYSDAGHGPAMLLIHGFPLDGRIWEPVIPLLTSWRRTIVPDLRGFGRSDPSDGLSMRQLAMDIAGFISQLGLEACEIAGLSMGGYVLQELAAVCPQLFSRLILLDTKSDADTPEGKLKRDAMAQTARDQGAKAVADQMFPNMLAPDHDPAVGQRLRDIMQSQRSETIAQACVAMRDRADFNDLLTKLDFPVDVIVGDQDVISPPALMQAMRAKVKRGRYFEIPGAGHLSPMENPAAVAAALLKTIES